VIVDGQVRDDRTSAEYQPFIYCLVNQYEHAFKAWPLAHRWWHSCFRAADNSALATDRRRVQHDLAPSGRVATQHAVSMTPRQAPAFKAMIHIGQVFHQFDTDSTAMVVLEGQDKLGDSARKFYDHIVGQLGADTAHVENVQDFWSDPLTAAGSQGVDEA
jgi:hypothetical protein